MKTLALCLLLPLTSFAGSRGALRALEEVQDLVADSDADCSRKLGKKLDALAGDLEDGLSSRKLRERVRDVRGFAEDSCPRKLAGKVKRALAAASENLGDDDDDRRRRRRSRDDDDEDDAPEPRRRAAARDCGTGNDPGCNLAGPAPMDAVSFRGLVSALSSTPNEFTKLDLVRNAVANQRLTAQQLGPLLDQFQNEFVKLDMAKAAVPRLVDPQHALVHSGKFRNTFIASDFSKLLSR